jgi:prepilin-type N-terminal cleavage/methylation domain-containing protein
MLKPSHLAFTLIELLVVVSIIGILAAIGLANLLEAQTRSKVAAALSDHRTLATALEAYHADNSVYPEDYAVDTFQGGFGMGRLTSPIAYLGQIPRDVFGGYVDRVTAKRVISYTLGTAPEDRPNRWLLASVGPNQLDETSPAFDYPGYTAELFDQQTGAFRYLRYDPTNGMVSNGDIIRVSDSQSVTK